MTRNVPPDLLPGTLDLLILRILTREPMHGYGIAQRLKLLSQDVLQVGESSLYPALQRLLLDGYIDSEWGPSENNRRAPNPGQRRHFFIGSHWRVSLPQKSTHSS